MNVVALDPGPTRTAWLQLRDGNVARFGLEENAVVRRHMEDLQTWGVDGLVIEMIASYGCPVGAEVFDTCVWIGRFYDSAVRCNIPERDIRLMKRQEVKLSICKTSRANDASIRQALIDRYGPGKDKAIGSKKIPGPLYGLKADLWAALAVAVTWWDEHKPAGYRT